TDVHAAQLQVAVVCHAEVVSAALSREIADGNSSGFSFGDAAVQHRNISEGMTAEYSRLFNTVTAYAHQCLGIDRARHVNKAAALRDDRIGGCTVGLGRARQVP